MPNHVMNRIEFIGKNAEKVIDIISNKGDGMVIDFEKIKPMPDYIYRGALSAEARKLYGKNNWYDWHVANWGTKWNAYAAKRDKNVITFQTAWRMPYNIYLELAEICKAYDVEFEGAWSNEDWSYDSGIFGYRNGFFEVYADETDSEHIERCKELWGYDPEDDYDENCEE